MQNRLSNPGGIHMTHLRTITLALAVLALATPLIAQSVSKVPAVSETPSLAGSAVVSIAPLAPAAVQPLPPTTQSLLSPRSMTPTAASHAPLVSAMQSGSSSQNTALMLVGGAGIIVGAVVGGKAGTVLMVGGSVVGLVGLWNYLR